MVPAAALDPEPAVFLLRKWFGQRRLLHRYGEVGPEGIDLMSALTDLAVGIHPEPARISDVIEQIGMRVAGVTRDGGRLCPVVSCRGVERPVSRLSTGEYDALAFVVAVASSSHQYLIADCPAAQLDRAFAERVLSVATLAFAGSQLFITTRHAELELSASSRVSLDRLKLLQGAV
jgi:hypothetical protein